MTFSLVVFVLIIFTFSQMIFSSSPLKSTKPTVSLIAEPLDDHQTFRLTTEQCPHLAKIFTSSGLVSATYLDSCSARFLHLDRLYDETLLLSISLDAWHHGSNRTVVNLATLAQQIGSERNTVFNYLTATLVVRLDGCRQNSSVVSEPKVSVRISPPPRMTSESGLSTIHLTPDGVGELLVDFDDEDSKIFTRFRADIFEVVLPDEQTDQHSCSLANTRLLVCGKTSSADQDQQEVSNCHVHLFQEGGSLVECRCDSSGIRGYLFALVVGAYLLLLITTSLTIKSKDNIQTEGVEDDDHFIGLTEEHVMGNVASRAQAYHYQVIYRVACPTIFFNTRSTVTFEVLGGRGDDPSCWGPLYSAVGFAITADESGGLAWNVFTTDVFLPAPLPRVRAVRTSHDGHPHTGLYLFDVHVLFIRKPKDDDDDEDSDYSSKRPITFEGRSQRLSIFAYILDYPNVYLKVEKGVPVELPPIEAVSELPLPFLKLLAWLATTQALLFSAIALQHFYLSFNMLLVCLISAFSIATFICLQLVSVIWLHRFFEVQSLYYQLLYECLADRGDDEEDNEEGGEDVNDTKKSPRKKKSKKRKKKRTPLKRPWNCAHILNTFLILFLLAAIGASLGALFLLQPRKMLLKPQPPLKALYAEVIILLSLVLVAGSLWLLLSTSSSSSHLRSSRIATEERLMAESALRGSLHLLSSTITNKSTATTTMTRTEERKSDRRKSKSPSSPATRRRGHVSAVSGKTPKEGTFEMISTET